MTKSDYQLTAIMANGNLIDLVECEFVAEGINSLEEAIDAAQTALDYDGEQIEAVRIDSANGYEGMLSRVGFIKD